MHTHIHTHRHGERDTHLSGDQTQQLYEFMIELGVLLDPEVFHDLRREATPEHV